MARTRPAVFLLLSSIFCAVNCSFDKQNLDRVLGDDTYQQFDLAEPTSINILVTGRVGVGKSTLVNALVGMDVAKTGTNVRGVTKNVERKVSVKNGIHVYITDTPGLGNLDIDDEDILRRALGHSNGTDTDLFLFCMNMTHRFDHQYLEEMKAITNIFGKAIWKKGMIMLTSANAWNEQEKFISKVHEWEAALRKITKRFIDPEVAEKIPIVPTGFKDPQLPDRLSWVTDVWVHGFSRMGFKPMFKDLIQLKKTKMYKATDGVKPRASQDMCKTLEYQPPVTCYMSKDEMRIYPEDEWQIFPNYILVICPTIGGVLFSVMSYAILHVKDYFLSLAFFVGYFIGNWVVEELENLVWIVKEEEHTEYEEP